MKEKIIHINRALLIKLTNLFSGMHFWEIKRTLLNMASDISIGRGTRIVGPIWAGSVVKLLLDKIHLLIEISAWKEMGALL
jgi:hypothetical protein